MLACSQHRTARQRVTFPGNLQMITIIMIMTAFHHHHITVLIKP
jgi:hypothetical protein